MNKKKLSIILWVLAVILTLGISTYQRMTGPTKPMRGEAIVNEQKLNYKLIRTWGKESPAEIKLSPEFNDLDVLLIYKRFKSHDNWDTIAFVDNQDYKVAYLPQLPPAGKMIYQVKVQSDNDLYIINSEPAVLRYKGSVPAWALIPHIILMYLAMLFSMRTGFEALFVRKKTFKYSLSTLIFLVSGGLIFGAIVQKFAFGAYWTGWPFGTDLTDNKTAIAIIMWTIAVFVLRKNRNNLIMPVLASIILLLVYLIPHSMMGSEIDFTEENNVKTEILD